MALQQKTRTAGMTVTESVRSRPAPQNRAYLLVEPEDWTADHLRAYVTDQISMRFDTPRTDSHREAAIFERFHRQWKSAAGQIAQYAFEVCDGYWKDTPISVQRFCKHSDPYFAIPIIEKLIELAESE